MESICGADCNNCGYEKNNNYNSWKQLIITT